MLVSVLGMKILCLLFTYAVAVVEYAGNTDAAMLHMLFPYAVAVVEYAGNADAAYVVDVCCYCCC